MNQDLNTSLTNAAQDPEIALYCEEIAMIVEARSRNEITPEEAAYLLNEMAEVRLAQVQADKEIYVRWAVAACQIAAKLI